MPALWLFATPALALYALFILWPAMQVVWLSMHQWNGYGPQRFVGLDNFATLWSDSVFHASVLHSILWLAGAVLLAPGAALVLALVARAATRGTAALAVLFFPALLPATVVASIAMLVYSPLAGLLNWLLRGIGLGRFAADWLGDPHLALGALFVAWLWSTVGIGTVILWTSLGAIGREFVDLALVEGAGRLQRFRLVTLPGVRRAVIVVALIDAILAAQAFDLVFVTTGGGPGYATMILPIDMYVRAFNGHTGEGAAGACVQILLLLIVVAVLAAAWRRAPSLDSGETSSHPRGGPTVTEVLLVLALVPVTLPFLWLLFAALQPGRSFAIAGPSLDPARWTLSNLSAVWSAGLPTALVTGLALALAVTAATLLLALPAAFALARLPRHTAGLLALLLLGVVLPTVVLLIPLFPLLKSLGLLNTAWGVVLPEIARALPFAILVLWTYLAGLPAEILEAAAVDGASPAQQLIRIALPVARPAVLAAGIWAFVSSWNEYLLPTIVSQDGSLVTVPTLLAGFAGSLGTQLGVLAAGSILAMLPSLLIYLALRRPAAAGIGAGGRLW